VSVPFAAASASHPSPAVVPVPVSPPSQSDTADGGAPLDDVVELDMGSYSDQSDSEGNDDVLPGTGLRPQ
jgi:hypothetical protein